MTRTIGQRELRNDNATVIAAVAPGETFIVTRSGMSRSYGLVVAAVVTAGRGIAAASLIC
ncbi:MAG: hypothetical protein NVS3B26_19990 [Mycobacteriales bacterium]